MTSDLSQPAPTPMATLDPGALARLRELDPDGRMGVLTRVMTVFETTLTRMLVQLTAELDEADVGVVVDVAHQLRSSSASLGALSLARACTDIEKRWRAPAAEKADKGRELKADVGLLLREAEAALAAVRAMLHS